MKFKHDYATTYKHLVQFQVLFKIVLLKIVYQPRQPQLIDTLVLKLCSYYMQLLTCLVPGAHEKCRAVHARKILVKNYALQDLYKSL